MNYLLDIALIAIFLLVVMIDAKRGFVKSVWGFVTALASLALSFLFGGYVGDLLLNTWLRDLFADATLNVLKPIVESGASGYDITKLFADMPEELVKLAESCGADLEALALRYADAVNVSEESLVELASTISDPITTTISLAIGYVSVFFVALILMYIIGSLFNLISKLPIIKGFNTLLGGVFGAMSGLIYIWVICIALAVVVECGVLGGYEEYIESMAESSYIFRLMCEFSPFDFINIKAILFDSVFN